MLNSNNLVDMHFLFLLNQHSLGSPPSLPHFKIMTFFLMKGTQTLVIEYAKCRLACHHLTEAEGRF